MLPKTFVKALAWAFLCVCIGFIVSKLIAENKQTNAAATEEPKVIAIVGDTKFTTQHIDLMAPGADNKKIRSIVNQWINEELLYLEAKKHGIVESTKDDFAAEKTAKKHAVVSSTKDDFIAERTKKRYYGHRLKRSFVENVVVTEKEVKNYYKENKGKSPMLAIPGRLSFTHIRTKTLKEANAVLEKLKAGEDIRKLVKEVSIHSDSRKNGRVKRSVFEIVARTFGNKFLNALLEASEGQLIGPVEVEGGFYEVARHEGMLAPKTASIGNVKAKIREKIESIKISKEYNDLIKTVETANKEVYRNPEFYPPVEAEEKDIKQKTEK